jgi:hypothetical protein
VIVQETILTVAHLRSPEPVAGLWLRQTTQNLMRAAGGVAGAAAGAAVAAALVPAGCEKAMGRSTLVAVVVGELAGSLLISQMLT